MKITSCLFLLIVLVGMNSCNNYKEEFEKSQQQAMEMKQRLRALEEEEKLIKGEYSDAIETLNAIDDTLKAIAGREQEILAITKDQEFKGKISQKKEIIQRLQRLRDANEKSKNEAKKMQRRIRSYQIENQQLKKMIAQAESRIVEKEAELEEAHNIIADMETALTRLEGQLSEKSGELADAYADLQVKNKDLEDINGQLQKSLEDLRNKDQFISDQAKAYVACGSKRVLRKLGILAKLSSKKLTKEYQKAVKAHGARIDYFKKGDIDCDGEGKIINVLPARSPSSYEIKGSQLIVKNKKVFWATDKVVVLIKE